MRYWRALKNPTHVIRYLTLRKIANFIKYRNDQKKRKVVTSSFPPDILFQASGYCNSNCRLCPVGLGIRGPQKGFLTYDMFKSTIDEAEQNLILAAFGDWGEPFLNPKIFAMIKYAEGKKIMTSASTNLHYFRTKDDLKKLLDSGLSFLTISLHGVSPDTYEAYQPGKNFEQTLHKIEILTRLKKILKKDTPIINLGFAITKKNEHEIEKMKQLAQALGVDSSIYTASLNLRFYLEDMDKVAKMVEEWAQVEKLDSCASYNTQLYREGINELYEAVLKNQLDGPVWAKNFCTDPWRSLVVNWNGTVSLCCVDYDKYIMGDTNEDSIFKIWNSKRYRAVRMYLLGDLDDKHVDFPCKHCIRY